METTPRTTEQFNSYQEAFKHFSALAKEFNGLPVSNIWAAYDRANSATLMNPWIQNQRVKGISSLPVKYDKTAVGNMIVNPNGNEQPLREELHELESSIYPMRKIRTTYQSLLTYRFYSYPTYVEDGDAKKPEFIREMRLVDKINKTVNPAANARKFCGQAMQEGKVFYAVRSDIDKVHNKVNDIYLQQLPSDWCKIVGFNNISGYTVAFNMFYFFRPGTSWTQFGDLFAPYVNDFGSFLEPIDGSKSASKGGFVYASNNPRRADGTPVYVNMDTFKANREKFNGSPELFSQDGQWYYWVFLPIDKVFAFEIDETDRNVVSPLTGLYLPMLQLADLQQIQLSLVMNPLVAVLTGEIPYTNNAEASQQDPYKLSPTGRTMFQTWWYQMLAANNTSGVGIYSAPFENITLQQLAESPSAMEIVTNGIQDTVSQSGLSAILPAGQDNRAGTVNVSYMIESQYAKAIYTCMERLMNQLYKSLNLKWEWRFVMFGSLAEDKDTLKMAKEGMTLGILSDTVTYLSLNGRSLLDDLSISRMVEDSEILSKRLPLVSTYSARAGEGNLPPVSDVGGRPKNDGIESEGAEDALDAPTSELG